MQPSTATKCLAIAFESGDYEAVKIISPHVVWSGDDATCFDFIEEADRQLKRAKLMRTGRIDEVRKAMLLCASVLFKNGFRFSNEEWLKLANLDGKIFEGAAKAWFRSGAAKEDIADMFHFCMSPPVKNAIYAEAPPKVVSKVLIQLKVDPDYQDESGNTFLHAMWARATHTTRFDIAFEQRDLWWAHTESLSQYGVSAYLKNSAGESVPDMIEYCLAKGLPHIQGSQQILASIKGQALSSQTASASSMHKARARL